MQVSVFKASLILFASYIVVSLLGSFSHQILTGLFLVISFIWLFILVFIVNIFRRLSEIDRYLLKKNPQAGFFPFHHISSQEFMESGLFKTADLNMKGDSLIIDNHLKICHISVQELSLKLRSTQSLFDGIFITKKMKSSHATFVVLTQKDGIKDEHFPDFLKELTDLGQPVEIGKTLTSSPAFNSKFNIYCNNPSKINDILNTQRIQLIGNIIERLNALLPLVHRAKNISPFQIRCSFKNDHFYMAIKNLHMKLPLLNLKRRRHFNTLSNIIETITEI